MSDNRYAPPAARLGSAMAPRVGTGDVDVGRCLSDAWAHCWENFPLWLGAGVVWVLALAASGITVVGLIIWPALAWGGTRFLLRMHDGGAELNDFFSGFSRFGDALRVFGVLILAMLGLSIAASSLQFAGAAAQSNLFSALGYLVSLAFNILVMPRLYLAFFYAVDQGESGTNALRRAWTETETCKWKIVLLGLLAYPIMIAGLLALIVGVFPAIVIWYLMYVSAYRQIAGTPGAA